MRELSRQYEAVREYLGYLAAPNASEPLALFSTNLALAETCGMGACGMGNEREAIADRFLEKHRLFYHRYLQLGGLRLFADIDLTMTQLKVLFLVVSLDGATMSQIARGVGMTLSTATGVADRLIAQAFVSRTNDPADRRVVCLVPTEEGTSLVERLTQFGREQLSLVVKRLDLEELSLVARAQDVLYEALLETTPEDLASAEAARSGRTDG